jgi:WD40 repeat protein
MLLAVEAYRRSDTPATKGALLSALAGQTSVGPASGASALELLTSVPTSFRGFVTTGLESPVALSISADGTRFTVGANESHTSGEVLVVYDVATGREIRRITGEARGTGRALGAQISPDGTYVMIANTDVINAWSVADGTVRAIARAGPVEFAGASLAPDGTLIAASMGDGSIAVFDPATGATVDVGELPVAVPGLVAFIPDGRLAIGLAAPEPGLLLWDVVARRESVHVTLEVPPAPLTPPLATYTFSPDGTRLILAISDDGPSLFVWDVASGRLIGDATKRPRVVRNAPVFVSSQVAAIGHVDGSITYYDFVDEEVVAVRSDAHGGGIWALASTPDGTTLLSGSDDGTVGIWGRGEHGLIDEPLLRGGQVVSVSADGTRYAVVGRDGVVRVGTVDGGALIEVPVPSSLPGKPAAWVALSADGSRVAVEVDYGDGRTVPFVADAATGRTVWQGAIIQPVAAAVPSEDGSLVYTLTPDQRVLLATEVTTGRPVATRVADSIEDDAAFGEEISPTPDGRFVDMLLPNSIARLDARTLERIAAVPVDEVLQGNIVAIPGTDQVVAVGRLGRIVRVDMVTGEVVTGRSRDSSSLGGLAIDAGGEVVAAVHPFAGTIALFDTTTLQPIGLPIPALAAIYNPGFLSGGQLVGATPIGISRWEMNPEEWRRIACRSAGRNLTQAEWSEYLGDEPYRPTCPDWPAATD